jgi:surfeit locus 1 family protein
MSIRRFRPRAWSVLAYLPVVALLVGLGTWQPQRGLQKLRLDQAIEQSQDEVDWHAQLRPRLDPPLRVTVAGVFRPQTRILLDGQSRQRRPGYHVWSVLETPDGGVLLVNRGWLPAPPGQEAPVLPAPPEGPHEIAGLWRPLPVPGLRLAAPPCQGVAPSATPLIVQYPDIATLRCLTGLPLADGIVLQDPAAGDALVRDWTVGQAVPPTRHFGYAAQWFMFALVLSYFFVRLNLRNSRDV